MNVPRTRIAIDLAVIIVLAIVFVGLLLALAGVFSEPTLVIDRDSQIELIMSAIWQYAGDHNGMYPYDPSGQDASLYLLKDYVSAETFRVPGPQRRPGRPRPYWDDQVRALMYGDYLYVNWRALEHDRDMPLICESDEAVPEGPWRAGTRHGNVVRVERATLEAMRATWAP